ncbi:reverse transcriptase domain-containing protein [Citrus sinensis]|nr:reverse transcriptase domain-containing protein [Citrus sinensis]
MENVSELAKKDPPLLEDNRSTKKAKFRAEDLMGKEEERVFGWEDVVIETGGHMPSIAFSQRVNDQLVKPWKATVVIKLLGRSVGYKVLCNRLESLWSREIIDSIIAWIRLLGMPLHYYHKRILRMLGHVIGNVVRTDYNTESASRGKFARIAVELDLAKPLYSQFLLDGKVQKVEYENLPTICFECGKYGHLSSSCSENKSNENLSGAENVQAENNLGTRAAPPQSTHSSGNPKFGPRMVVSRKGKFKSNKNKHELASTPNPLYFCENGKDKEFGDQPVGSPPDLGGWNMDNMTDDPDDSDYIRESGDEDSEESSSAGSLEDKNQMALENQAFESERVLSQGFRRTFNGLVKNYNPTLVAVFEPRVSDIKADNLIRKSGFARSHRVEAMGFSGGIWLLWKEGLNVEIVMNHRQFIHFRVSNNSGLISSITAIYASPIPSVRKLLWSDLNELASFVQGPWLLGGDFNAILNASEKQGGSLRSNGVCQLFNGWFHRNKFCDLEFKGPSFTWARGSLHKRLDRAICNDNWIERFSDASVLHLPKVCSDHRPILVRFGKPQTAQVFGNIFRHKNRLLVKIGGIQRALEKYHSNNLTRLEIQLKKELEAVLTQEEILWYQKSRREWIQFGDRNTTFFHRKTIQGRRRNHIEMIKDDLDNWLLNNDEIKDYAMSFFSKLYSKEDAIYHPYHVVNAFPILEESRMQALGQAVEDEEIKNVIFSMKALKAPGIDRLHALFYQT